MRLPHVLPAPLLAQPSRCHPSAGASPALVPTLCDLTARTIFAQPYSAHAAVLQQDDSLRRTSVHGVLVPALRACSVAAQLPPDRRPPTFSPSCVSNVAGALASPALQLHTLSASDEAEAISCMQLLQASLLEYVSHPDADAFSELAYINLTRLLGSALSWLPSDDAVAARQAAEHCLPAVHHLPTALRLPSLVESLSADDAAAMCLTYATLSQLLVEICFDRASLASRPVRCLQDVPACHAAGTAAGTGTDSEGSRISHL